MSKIAILCVDGVEEVECLTTVDFCRRAGIEVTTVSMTGRRQISGSHGIRFVADAVYEEMDFSGFDGIVLPGGPGTSALDADERVHGLAKEFFAAGKLVAAICAAPSVLANAGILKGKNATAYPGFCAEGAANWTGSLTERDGNLITGRGPGAAPYFALELIEYLCGNEKRSEVYTSTQMP